MDELVSKITTLIKGFHSQLASHLPALELEINRIIKEKKTNAREIENYLDTLLSLSQHGIGNALYIKLLEYYKTIDEEGARFYWEEYDGLEDWIYCFKFVYTLRWAAKNNFRIDKIKKIQKAILSILNEYAKIEYANVDGKNYVIADKENHHYQVMTIGWQGAKFVHDCPMHFAIINNKIWVQ